MNVQPRKVKSLGIAESSTKTDELPTGRLLEGFVKVGGNLVATGGSSDPTLTADMATRIVKRIRILVGGKEVQSISGQDAYHLATIIGRYAPTRTTPTISGAATYAFASILPLFFALPQNANQHGAASLFASHGKLDPTIEIEYGTTTDLATGGDRVLTITGLTSELYMKFCGSKVDPQLFRFLNSSTKTIGAASDKFEVKVPYGPGLFHRMLVLKARLAGALSDAVVNRVVLKSGEDTELANFTWAELKDECQRQLQIAMPTGYVALLFDESKDWKGSIDTGVYGDLRLELDVDAPSGVTDVTCISDSFRKV